MSEEELRSFLKDEYLHIERTIIALDGRTIVIKAWSVSFSLASATGAFVTHEPHILLITGFSAFLFCMIEGIWKGFQYGFYGRSGEIERYFRGEVSLIAPFQIDRQDEHVRKNMTKNVVKAVRQSHVYLPHLVITVASLTTFITAKLKIISF